MKNSPLTYLAGLALVFFAAPAPLSAEENSSFSFAPAVKEGVSKDEKQPLQAAPPDKNVSKPPKEGGLAHPLSKEDPKSITIKDDQVTIESASGETIVKEMPVPSGGSQPIKARSITIKDDQVTIESASGETIVKDMPAPAGGSQPIKARSITIKDDDIIIENAAGDIERLKAGFEPKVQTTAPLDPAGGAGHGLTIEDLAPPPSEGAAGAKIIKTPAARDPETPKPYWQEDGPQKLVPYWVAAPEKPDRPYYMPDAAPLSQPYWVASAEPEPEPYWADKTQPDDWPYWLPPPKPPQEVVAATAAGPKIASYYMFKDERGVAHLTNAPNDPRYRLFTVEVTVVRGMQMTSIGLPRKFTHESLRGFIMNAAYVHNLDPALIAAVIKSESAFDSQAVSWAGAQGLMQLMPGTAKLVGCKNPFDPEDNIMGGSRYLRMMLNRFNGNVTLAVAAYNCGPERVVRSGWVVPNIKETQNYVKIVKGNYEKYQASF